MNIIRKLKQNIYPWKICYFISQQYKLALQKYYTKNQLIKGWCTSQASLKYSRRNSKIHGDNWRKLINTEKNTISSLGIGTFNGDPSNQFDYQMFNCLTLALQSGGVNYVDTCPLYRYGKSQKVINAVLNYLIKQKGYERQQFLISTKCGYIPCDVDSNLTQQNFINILKQQNLVKDEDIVKGIHCIHPNFLQFSLQKSRLSLGLETIDIFYLNNFSQSHLPIVGNQVTFQRLQKAFQKFEQMVNQNRIKYYGLSSYVGLRSPTTEEGVHLNLQRVIETAKKVGGVNHKFRYIMIPLSLGTPETILKWQDYKTNNNVQKMNIFEIAEKQNINVIGCSPLFQGKVAKVPFQSKNLDYLPNLSAKHLQLMRSYYSQSLKSTLVGVSNQQQIIQNLSLLSYSRLNKAQWRSILPVPE